ncbi:MAG TPA: hypothetical protein GX740_04815 [Acholeplasmataceae bacterium]|nr:hypothetical protein [Acholeplasmataceae bacterium]
MISFREQVILIIYFLIFGMFLGAMFDILHYFLRRVKVKQIISYIIELIFWICMVIIACLYMLKVSEGYLTIYTFLFFLYRGCYLCISTPGGLQKKYKLSCYIYRKDLS